MTIGRLFLAAILACSLGGMALAEDKKDEKKPEYKAGGCCDKAKKAGEACKHECCVKAEADKKVCAKCNAPKKESK